MIQQDKTKHLFLSLFIAVLAFSFDLYMPLGVAGGVLYVALVFTGTWYTKRRYTIILAISGIVLTVIGFFVSPIGSEMWLVLTNRGLAIFAIFITALLVIYIKTSEMALQEREERFRFFFELASEGVIISDKGKYLDANKAAETILGYSHQEFLKLEPKNLILKKDIASVKDHMVNNIEDQYEVTAIKKDGTLFPIEIRTRTTMRNNKLLHVTLFRDITTRKKQQEKLRHASAKADEANRAKSDFLASMSHELRTPLNAVLGFAQMLQFDPQNPLNKTQNDHVNNILGGGSHLLELVNEVLDLSCIESHQLDLSLIEVNVGEVIADCINLSSQLGRDRGIKIIDEFNENCKTLLKTDKLRLKQIIINLLSNAVKFNKDGGTVTITGYETDNHFLRISISDTGAGIAKSDHAKVFHKFNRLNADPMVYSEGTGIGLAVCQLLVERMAGKISFCSDENLGSTFWIELPLASNPHALIWTTTMRTGIDVIDNDHQVLIMLLNRASNLYADDPQITEIVDELIDYTEYHFKREERIMEISQYPDIGNHKEHHTNLINMVKQLAADCHNNHSINTVNALRHFLRNWLFNHIIKEDLQLIPFVRGKSEKIHHTLNGSNQ